MIALINIKCADTADRDHRNVPHKIIQTCDTNYLVNSKTLWTKIWRNASNAE